MAGQGTREDRFAALDDRMITLALARADTETLTREVGESLRAAGVALDEMRVSCRTLHPDIDAIGVNWAAGQATDTGVWRHADSAREKFRQSPMYHMMTEGVPRLRRAVHDPDCPMDFPVLHDFRRDGVTDYLCHLVPVGDPRPRPVDRREGFILRWLSRAPGGFSDADVEVLDRMSKRLVAACEPGLERAIARNLLDTYIGPRSGSAVLDGSVQSGDTDLLEAVILVADLAGFTSASDTMDGETLVAFLGRHLEAMVPPVQAENGEILTYLGDGFLAAFGTDGDARTACRRGARAARAIQSGIEALREADPAALPVDVSLHIGTVRYGNVCAGGRQAFTVIGPAVNLASRIEALCGPLGHHVLVSEDVARHLDPQHVVSVGDHAVRGYLNPVPLFSWI
jgi:adenylate cyclase